MSPLQKITRIKNTITQSWTYNHPHTIITLTLATVILAQNTTALQSTVRQSIAATLANTIPSNEITAYNPNNHPEALTNCDYKCLSTAWVNLRTEQLYNEQEADTLKNLRHTARIQALTEANDQFKDVILNQ